MISRCLIIGSGASIRSNWNISIDQQPIWNAIQNECLFTLNYSYLFCNLTIALVNDYQVYVIEKEKLDKLSMVVSIDDSYYKRSQDPYRDEIRCELGKNLYLLKGANEYYGENSWKKGFYSKELAGVWAINFALRCGFKQIYLLGFDSCSINGHTHFYDDNPEIGKYQWQGQIHYGIGFDERGYYRTGVYNRPKKLNQFWFKPFENEKDKIINVSPNSAIDTFEKWNYERFYQYLKENPIQINQEEVRQEIKELIKNKS